MTQTLIEQVQQALIKMPEGVEEIARIRDLMLSPLRVTPIDVRLAAKGWVEIYDTTPGNEMVDISPLAYSYYAEQMIKHAVEQLTRTDRAKLNHLVVKA
jgi:hypothetical protein